MHPHRPRDRQQQQVELLHRLGRLRQVSTGQPSLLGLEPGSAANDGASHATTPDRHSSLIRCRGAIVIIAVTVATRKDSSSFPIDSTTNPPNVLHIVFMVLLRAQAMGRNHSNEGREIAGLVVLSIRGRRATAERPFPGVSEWGISRIITAEPTGFGPRKKRRIGEKNLSSGTKSQVQKAISTAKT